MCQMYAIFEEVIGPQPSVTFTKDLQVSEDDDQGIVVTSGDQQSTPEQDISSDSASQYGSSKAKTKRNPGVKHPRTHRIRNSATLPRNGRRRLSSNSSDFDDASTTSSSNPLLDTISVLTYDPPDDSDDYYDLTSAYNQCRTKEDGEKQVKNPSTTPGTEGDRDSIGYAGSSSIDSGYKSFCPTPELPDSSYYGTDRTQPYSGYYPDSSTVSQGRGSKPRIMMGTKVITRQGQVSPTASLREFPASRRSDSSLYDVNLDHLMYLRQSLLSAIQKCESGNKSDTGPKQRKENSGADKSSSLVEDQHYSDSSPAKSVSSYQKTVRFNTDVKVTTVNSSQPPSSDNSDQNHCRTGDSPSSESSTNKTQSKSILKDPLCANLRSQLEAGSTDCTLEEEIDSLLYGRAEFYDLENVDEFPCSYVTMIEEKYRSGKPSLAKVRKLKGGKANEQTAKSAQAAGSDDAQNSATAATDEDPSKQQKTSKDNSSPSTVSISKTAKCRFTEVARCMLEIIEDLQMKKMQPEAAKDSTAAASEASKPPEVPPESKPEDSSTPPTDSKSQFYTSAAEYHVYEEIAYDIVGESPVFKVPDVPPPLPARPTTMFVKSDQQRPSPPSPPPRKGRNLLKRSLQIPESSLVEVRNRPKQRGNLYCLFSDRAERRSISRSLEREFRVSGTDNQDDDYGFRKEFLSI